VEPPFFCGGPRGADAGSSGVKLLRPRYAASKARLLSRPNNSTCASVEGVDEAILRGLTKDKATRYKHAGQFAAALANALAGDRPQATGPTTPIL
jgi:hypothetical protein